MTPRRPTKKRPNSRTTEPIGHVLPSLLDEHGLSVNALAERVGVEQSHLSRGLRGADNQKISGQLAARIASALALPEDYFLETREACVIELVKNDPRLVDCIYDAQS